MLSSKMESALNEQINRELYSSYLYLAMSAYCETQNLPGTANWLRLQSREEYEHAMRIYEYILDRGGKIALKSIAQPPADFGSPVKIFEQTLEHEKFISDKINALYAMAQQENDYPTQVMLQWFITEQVEEEKSTGEILGQLKMIGDNPAALIVLDRQLAARQSGA